MTELQPGSRWRSAVCSTEVIVVKAPSGAVSLECGGHPMVAIDSEPASGLALDADFAEGTKMGKRVVNAETGG